MTPRQLCLRTIQFFHSSRTADSSKTESTIKDESYRLAGNYKDYVSKQQTVFAAFTYASKRSQLGKIVNAGCVVC